MSVKRFRLALVVGLLAAVLAGGPGAGRAAAKTFSDVTPADWFAAAVTELSDAGVITGLADGSFRPYETVTRAQFATMLARAVQPPAAAQEPFVDVYSSDWFYAAVTDLYAAGLITGTTATTFSPGLGIDRQQTATLLMRAVGYTLQSRPQAGVDLALPADQVAAWLGGFKDREAISPVHAANLANAVRFGIVIGSGDGWFYPIITVTRAQAAGMIHRALYQPLRALTGPPAPVPAEAYPVLRRGATGPLVQYIETRLASLKYDVGTVDGRYDEATKDAVVAFQKVEGLVRDGEVGPEVWSRIVSAGVPALRLPAGGDRVEVDLTRQVLFLVNAGRIVRILPVSTGAEGWRTPPGHFRIQRKLPYWRESALGLLYKPSYFNGGIAIHGAYSVPPYPASHGCVRVPYWATDALYPLLPIGMPVDVYY
ncbi:MAG: hypothetical protein Kow00122_21190 [Thermoleophilia bacterium]